MKCPPISKTIVFADDVKLAAHVCCALAVPGVYLPVCEGPRMQRPDAGAARLKPDGTKRIENTKETLKVLRRELGHFLRTKH